ncbi:MAG: hypothetical protein R3C03_06645 [Pirellulaceae bacterium]
MPKNLLIIAIALILQFSGVRAAWAGVGPENVLLVVNVEDASSVMIANHYAHWRNIPVSNILYLKNVPSDVVTEFGDFRASVLNPIFEHLRDSAFGNQIDCIVYSTGFPTSVKVPKHFNLLKKQVESEAGDQAKEILKIYRGQVSTTAITYFLLQALAERPEFMTLDANRYYRGSASQLLTTPFVGETQDKYQEATLQIDRGEAESALVTLQEIFKTHPLQMAVHFQMARAYGRLGDAGKAAQSLIAAVRTGWIFRERTKSDAAFEKVKDDPVFKGLVDRFPDEPYEFAPTMGFSSRYSWAPNGGVNSSRDQGVNYVLCAMLGTTTNLGNTEQEILDYLMRSVNADHSFPKGTFYFCDTKDVRARTRKPNFQPAIKRLEMLGESCEVVTTPLPKDGVVAGAVLGASKFQWQESRCEIVPGAIIENLTSFGARFEAAGQTKLSELLKFGVAGTSGTVCEPYAIQQKFPHPMIQVHYRRGCTLAEAFYQSVSGPFHLLVMGDALCRPWAPKAMVAVEGITPNQTVSGQVDCSVSASEDGLNFSIVEVYLDGLMVKRQSLEQRVVFDSSKMSDGFHELRFVVIANDLIQNRYTTTIPITVDNEGESLRISSAGDSFDQSETIVFTIETKGVDVDTLTANGRPIAKVAGDSRIVSVDAALIGRGPISIQASGASKIGPGRVASRPLTITINGPISNLTDK